MQYVYTSTRTRRWAEPFSEKESGLADDAFGVPVPAGFPITTMPAAPTWPPAGTFRRGSTTIDLRLATLEERTGKRFGDPTIHMLVSVAEQHYDLDARMMNTVLNLG